MPGFFKVLQVQTSKLHLSFPHRNSQFARMGRLAVSNENSPSMTVREPGDQAASLPVVLCRRWAQGCRARSCGHTPNVSPEEPC